jgi:tRNA modification GTPase
LHAETVIDGWLVRLSDTAGIRDSCEPIEAEGVYRALAAADRADLVLYVSDPETIHDQASNEAWLLSLQGAARIPVLRILNKSDRLTTADLPSGLDLLTSATSGEGIDTLLAILSTKIAGLVPTAAAPVPMTDRQVDCLLKIANAADPETLIGALESLLGFDPPTQVAKP